MATTITAWSADLELEIDDLTTTVVEDSIRDACIRFCEQTHLWTSELTAIDVDADTQDYTLSIPATSTLIGVPDDGVYYKEDGEDDDQYAKLVCISDKITTRNESHAWKYEEGPRPSEFWVDNIDKDLHLRPIPTEDSDEGLLVTVILKPLLTATTVPDFLYDDYRREIASGALANLYKMKHMPWYDPDQFALHETIFMNACGDAKITKLTGATNKQLSFKIPFFV